MGQAEGMADLVAVNALARRRRRSRIRMTMAVLTLSVVALGAFFAVTGYTGFPGPGALHRYPGEDLDELARRINAACGDSVASVDRLRSRVSVDVGGISADRGGRGIAFMVPAERDLTNYGPWRTLVSDCGVPARGDPIPPPMTCGMCGPPRTSTGTGPP